LNQARQRLRDLELAAQEAAFAEKSHRSKMEEMRRNIARFPIFVIRIVFKIRNE